jgi:hypothetical protein
MSSLDEAIGRVYSAFSTIPKPHHIDGCPCCIDRKEVGNLLSKRLHEVTPAEIASYASSAFLTVGDVGDYLYFLPRILEISATEPAWWPDPEVTGRAIRAAKPDTWTESQRTALNNYLEAVINTIIQSENYPLLDEWICAIGRMGIDVTPFLSQIAKSPVAVVAYFRENAECLPRKRLANAFWELPCLAHDVVVEWFYSEEIAGILFKSCGYVLTPIK